MSNHLVFTLHATIGSFGALAVGERRGGFERPAKSAVLGLVAAALGLERDDEEAQIALASDFGSWPRSGRTRTDFLSTITRSRLRRSAETAVSQSAAKRSKFPRRNSPPFSAAENIAVIPAGSPSCGLCVKVDCRSRHCLRRSKSRISRFTLGESLARSLCRCIPAYWRRKDLLQHSPNMLYAACANRGAFEPLQARSTPDPHGVGCGRCWHSFPASDRTASRCTCQPQAMAVRFAQRVYCASGR